MEPRRERWTDVAQICGNGHLINDASGARPDNNEKFCTRCGAAVIDRCPSCEHLIRGSRVLGSSPIPGSMGLVPMFCCNCGQPFPWTNVGLTAAREVLDADPTLSRTEKDAAVQDLEDVARGTPRAPVAASRFREMLSKVATGTASSMRELGVSLLSETAKRMIWGP
jgi:hypothetical protein